MLSSSIHGRGPKHPRSPSKHRRSRSRSPRSASVPNIQTRSDKKKTQPKIFIAVFRGKDTEGDCDDEYENVLIKYFIQEIFYEYGIDKVNIESKCMSPPKSNQKQWASYTPANDEVTNDTHRADKYIEELETHASKYMQWVHDKVASGWIGVVVGISNGSIPASHLAMLYPDNIPVLTLVSTVPTPDQVIELKKLYEKQRVIMSICYQETFFGGHMGLRKVSEEINSDVLCANGRHCKETPFDMLMIGRLTAHKLGGSNQIKDHFKHWKTPVNTWRTWKEWKETTA